ncbi:MAG: hypothetical protein NZV14_18145 [Bryobacteraceae bacterium]|nr:hypothetical protein [Bryobacteraceae bacterium]MDW8380087.1 hypothetical protein [Bryobacterales bacterium]
MIHSVFACPVGKVFRKALARLDRSELPRIHYDIQESVRIE